jgi:hypothetical protein
VVQRLVGMKPTTPSLSTSDLAYPSKGMFILPLQMQHHKVVIEDQRFREIHVWGGVRKRSMSIHIFTEKWPAVATAFYLQFCSTIGLIHNYRHIKKE